MSHSEGKMRAESLREQEAQKMQEVEGHTKAVDELNVQKAGLKQTIEDSRSNAEGLEKEVTRLDARCKMLHMLLNGDDINAKLAEELRQLE